MAWAVDAPLAAGLETVVVQGALDLAGLVPGSAAVFDNPDWRAGQATSLQVGLRAAAARGAGAVVVGLGDQPLLTPEAWAAVAAADAPVAVATYGGRRGHPVRLAADVWPLVPTTGDGGARPLVGRRSTTVAAVACAGVPVDIDTVEDLERWS